MSADRRDKAGFARFLGSPLRIALAVSVLLNVFLGAAWLGRMAAAPLEAPSAEPPRFAATRASDGETEAERSDARRGERRRGFIARVMAEASPELKALMAEVQAERSEAFRASRAETRRIRAELIDMLAADPFDAEAFRALQVEALEQSAVTRRIAYEMFATAGERATPEQRAELADLLRRNLDRRRAGAGAGAGADGDARRAEERLSPN